MGGSLSGADRERNRPVPPQYAYQRVAEDLTRRIKSGEFPPGSRLPSRAQLCEEYEVSSFVADRVFLILKMNGLTDSLPGAGVYVKESGTAEG
ncbi:winged helix-turn-helix domain-containing protein [Micromonospora cathayae]|uniref:winged helix-turn-helix domain-containing protein n=1 Tax=Micromonospora cathayae TaxID=3028804 RepID=UPI003C6D5041